jgi:hypothetical protein
MTWFISWMVSLWSAHWPCFAGSVAGGFVAMLVGMRVGTRVGFELAASTRRRIADVAGPPEDEIPELFKSNDDRKREALKRKYMERSGRLPWNFKRPGMTEAEREALAYQLETGKLDKTIDRIVKEETEQT